MFRQISLGILGLSLGSILTVVGFAAYFADNATLNLVGFFYGFPLLLGGLALRASELKPIAFSQPTSPAVLELRKQQATVTQKKLRNDITRYQYGKNAHLEDALNYLGLNPSDEQRPLLTGLRETETDGAYTLTLEFHSAKIPLGTWQAKQETMTRYFGPNIKILISQPEGDRVDLALVRCEE
jgi:hypothetical protein